MLNWWNKICLRLKILPKWAPTIAHTAVEQNIFDHGIFESTFLNLKFKFMIFSKSNNMYKLKCTIGNDVSIKSFSADVILWWLEGDSLIW
jgi:hypothetical protein